MVSRLAVIDLGSNTFHLLIVDRDKDKLTKVYKERSYVSLCEGGGGYIKLKRLEYGLKVLKRFLEKTKLYQVNKLRILGTAVLRTAVNREAFLEKAFELTGADIEIISGQKEAELIYRGVQLFVDFKSKSHCVIDIGGGSTEIIYKNEHFAKIESLNFGIGQLYEMFHQQDPITDIVFEEIKAYIRGIVLEKFVGSPAEVELMIGSSGSFEILQNIYLLDRTSSNTDYIPKDWTIAITKEIALKDIQERKKIKKVTTKRLKYLSVGLAIIHTLVEIFQPQKILVSPFALKEGALMDM